MIKFIVGVIVGIMFSTIGVGGVIRILDSGVSKVQSTAKEAAQ